MRIIDADSLTPNEGIEATTIGNFDGVHVGHKHILDCARSSAAAAGGLSAVYTFTPHPAKVLAPKLAPPEITTFRMKAELIEAAGIDLLVVQKFDPMFAAMKAEEFVERVLRNRLGTRRIVVGFDLTLGRDRSAGVEGLRIICEQAGIAVTVVPPVYCRNILASSTKVREFISGGNVAGATMLLGRKFAVEGIVATGIGRGKALGFPTANLQTDQECLPRNGVYFYLAFVSGRTYPAAVNVGVNPTFSPLKMPLIEAHLIDLERDILGEKLRIEFHDRFRDEIRFESPQALAKQVALDVEIAKRFFSR